MNLQKIIKYRVLSFLLTTIVLSGCSTYSSSFSCGDAKGANCMSMDRVDRMIASGEIENFTDKPKTCRGRKCKENKDQGSVLRDMPKEAAYNYQLSEESF